jgi:hemerythrin superfamily protein
MTKATDALLKDHKLIYKTLEGFSLDNPRFEHILKTLQRVVLAHAWFEDEIFLPAFNAEPRLKRRFVDEIIQEHKDIDFFLALLRKTPLSDKRELESSICQLTAILTNHLKKEEDGLFPLAEKILDNEGLNRIGAEMDRRKTEVRDLVKD